MIKPDIPTNEILRQLTLDSLSVLDATGVTNLDQVTRLAAKFFGVEIALVSLVDRDRQWFLSRVGLEVQETARDISFCGHAILQSGTFIVPDTLTDLRFSDNPLVTGYPHIRFYAGQPLLSLKGLPMGTLCLIANQPRAFSPQDVTDLCDFSAIVEEYLHCVERKIYTESLESNLKCTESLFEQTFSQAAVGMALVSLNGYWLRGNSRLHEILRYSENELLALTFQDITHPDDLDADLKLLHQLLAGSIPSYSMQKRFFRSDRKIVWVQMSVALSRQSDGSPRHFITVIVDITERKEVEADLYALQGELEDRIELRTKELNTVVDKLNLEIESRTMAQSLLNAEKERLRAITDNMPAFISQVDANEVYLFANNTFMKWFGFDEATLKNMCLRDFMGDKAYCNAKPMIEKVLDGHTVSFENELRPRSGLMLVRTTLVPCDNGGFYILSMDISELKALQQRSDYEANHDILTGLPNRRAFLRQLASSIESSAIAGQYMALLFLDLDDFKKINDTQGHDFGDLVLMAVADLLSETLMSKGYLARLGGDEFTVILSNLSDPEAQVKQVCENVLSQLSALVCLGEIEIHLSISIGATICSGREAAGNELLAHADIAMYRAKSAGKGSYSIY
ncbi:PAS/PAC domain-containing protein [Yersinia intermedia]|uniref:diguanylate cyclase domain-containing protein n=1 Tax=Yersinia intermedia TaxID=631 RepID=UPI0005ABDACC|nr:diguanylate cyclase [Yersinia intermedia]AJJ18190.1 diguanylate cyclase domain protein [Yersinia intermedia]MDA5513778.1 diguanylate cyclase [Yersinia intermedia]CNI37491.1 PAS/PAC domain-containing protein [Yersinia intermedia]CQE06319.1 PAS/PAC domain-containing protein [Yersinia intermedia]